MSETIFLRLLSPDNKAPTLAEAIDDLRSGQPSSFIYTADSVSFRQIPGAPFAYWVNEHLRQVFAKLPQFEGEERMVRQGGVPGDNFRRLRAFWEVSPAYLDVNSIVWVPYAKGGTFSPYWSDVHLVVRWDFLRGTFYEFAGLPHRPSEKPASAGFYFRPGLTYPLRTTSGLSVRVMPAGCIFAHKGPGIFVAGDSEPPLLNLLALMQSEPFSTLLKLQLGAATAAARSYEVGLIQQMPVPPLSPVMQDELARLAREAHNLKRERDQNNEVTHPFTSPTLTWLREQRTLAAAVATLVEEDEARQHRLAEIQREIDERAYVLYGISSEDRAQIEQGEPAAITEDVDAELGAENEDEAEEIAPADRGQLLRVACADLLMYAVGCAFGRWDIRIGRDRSLAPLLAEPFAPLPVCTPGALVGPDGLPARPGHIVSEAWLRARPDAISLPPEGSVASPSIPDEVYPLSIAWDGILADDPDHEADILRHVRAALDLLWGERAEAIEQEACHILGVKELRDYFRRPGNDGFWMDHVKRYSKSRRKAPIYWLLQSSKRNYALWLYYHRLDKDILFKALTNYVEPKLRLEEDRLVQLRTQLIGAGNVGREARQLEKQLERQESLMAELYDFRDKLRRAADLQLVPDLNDGVVLNIAPLWELVPWSEARKYWEELQAGKYEWSSISKQLRERKVI